MLKHTRMFWLSTVLLVAVGVSVAQRPVGVTEAPGPRFKPGALHQSIGGNPGCVARCSSGPMRISPDPIDACEGEQVSINVRVDGNRMSTFGDRVENAGGLIDWGDGKEENLSGCCNWDLKHVYVQATTHYLSAIYGEQHNNANNPPGGCSYRCRLQQAATVIIHMKSSPECKGGRFKKLDQTKKGVK